MCENPFLGHFRPIMSDLSQWSGVSAEISHFLKTNIVANIDDKKYAVEAFFGQVPGNILAAMDIFKNVTFFVHASPKKT